jgi:two-component sensor histidine kinase
LNLNIFKKILFLLLLGSSLAGQTLIAQDKKMADTTIMMEHVRTAADFIGLDNQQAEEHLIKASVVADDLEYKSESANENVKRSIADFYSVWGYLYYNRNQLNEAIQSFEKAEALFEKINAIKSRAECLNNIAVILNVMGNNKEAIKNYHEAIVVYEKLKDSLGGAYAFNNVSRIYRQQGDFDQAMKYIDDALRISQNMNDKELESLSLNSKAGLLKVTGDTASSLATYEKALSIRKEAQDSIGIASILNNIGSIFKGQKKYAKALDYFEQSKEIAELTSYKTGIAHTNNNIGEVYFEQGKFNLAEKNAKKALEFATEVGVIPMKKQAAELLKNIYKQTKEWNKAFNMQEIILEANNLMVNQETKQIAQREAMRYAFEKERALDKKEEEQFMRLQREKDERERIYYVVIVLVAVLLLFLLFFVINRLRSVREQNKLILKQSNERKLLLQEVHHRVKNNFQIVSSLLRLQSYSIDNESLRNSFEEAVSRINSMAIVHDIIYRQEKFSEIDSKEYLEKLIKSLQQTSGSQEVDIVIHTDRPKLKIETLIHLGIALNELVINSFKYAFNDMHTPPKIKITLVEVGDKKFELLYQDNGIGLNKELSKSSFGMELIETLIEHLDGEVEIKNLDEWKTTIILRFADV